MHPLERIGRKMVIHPWQDVQTAFAHRPYWGRTDYVEVIFDQPLTPEELDNFPVSGFPGRPFVYSSGAFTCNHPPDWDTSGNGHGKHRFSRVMTARAEYIDFYFSSLSSVLGLHTGSFRLVAREGALFDWTDVRATVEQALEALKRKAEVLRIYASAGFLAEDPEGQEQEGRTERVFSKGSSTPGCDTVSITEISATPKSPDDPENVSLVELHFWEQWRGENMMDGLGSYPERAVAFFLSSFPGMRENAHRAMQEQTLLPLFPAEF